MTKNNNRQRSKATKLSVREAGIRALITGLGFLIIPLFFGASPMMKVVTSGLRFPGWLLLGLGLVLLVIDYATNFAGGATQQTNGGPGAKSNQAWPLTDSEKESLIAHIARHSCAKTRVKTGERVQREPVSPLDIKFGRTTNTDAAPARPREWSPALFAAIEWRRFEALCEALFAQAGFETESQSHGADGGVDIWLYSANAEGAAAIAQCKHWNTKPVGVREMREFFGVMASHQLKRGTYATSSTYTADAQQFAKTNGINALNGAALLKQISGRTPEQQKALLEVAFEGEYWKPTCASCGIKLVERKPAKGGDAFWGCNNYPRCKSTFPLTYPLQ
jgi:restriction system protein